MVAKSLKKMFEIVRILSQRYKNDWEITTNTAIFKVNKHDKGVRIEENLLNLQPLSKINRL